MNTKEVESSFVQLREMYKRIKDPEAKAWGLVLGTHNEVYIMKGDGKKSILLGTFSSEESNPEVELKKFLVALKSFFDKHGQGVPSEVFANTSETPAKKVIVEGDENIPYIPEQSVTMSVSDLDMEAEEDFALWSANIQ